MMNRHALSGVVALALLMGMSVGTRAQTQAPQAAPSASPAAPTPPQAQAKDVDSVEHILAAVYDVISGPAGPRDWDRFNSLFFTGARLIPSWRDAKGNINSREMSPEDYAKRATPAFAKEGFFEVSIANRVESWDHMAEVWSTYESRHAKGEKPFARGVNSFQLFFDGTRWWIVTIYWEDETPGHSLPEKYLSDSK
ncbi:MAG: hypothetical protein WA734_16755 [Candidatus Acidiferrales bacterium]